MPNVMIIGGGLMQLPAIKEAQKLGYRTIVTDYDANAIGLKIADYPVIISTKDIEGTVRLAKEINRSVAINGVLTIGTDASMTVAAVANALQLPGIRYEVAEMATNKIKMRQRLRDMKVSIPDFFGVWTYDEAVHAFKSLAKPVVIKPADNMGARGVKKIEELVNLRGAFDEAKNLSPCGEIIIEEFMSGPELSIDALIYDGAITYTGIADRVIEFPPYFVETGHILPSNLPASAIKAACKLMDKAIKALGIDHGAAKGDIKITPDGPKVGEIAARLSGGFMSTYTYPLATGGNSIRGAIKIALGQPPEIEETLKLVAVEEAIIPPPGKVVSITGVEAALAVEGIAEVIINTKAGETIQQVKSNMGKAGNLIAVGKNRKEALNRMAEAKSKINIEIGVPTLDLEEVKRRAREKFKKICRVCLVCNGVECAGRMPGIGSVGTGASFKNNISALAAIKVNLRTIHDYSKPDTNLDFFGYKLNSPVLIAPITGANTNLGGAIDEESYVKAVISGSKNSGTIAMLGDGATPDKYLIGTRAIKENNGWGIPIFKPRKSPAEVIERIRAAEDAGALAVGLDIDAACFITMALKGQAVGPKNLEELRAIVNSTSLPFILKGIMTKDEAVLAAQAGAKAIIVSNHGGRVMDYMPGSATVVPGIVEAVGDRVFIMVDGGVRTGLDVLKYLALGARAVLVGRPVCIGAVGGAEQGVSLILNQIIKELKHSMILTGCGKIEDIDSRIIFP